MLKFKGRYFRNLNDPQLINLLSNEQFMFLDMSSESIRKFNYFVELFEGMRLMTKEQMKNISHELATQYFDLMQSLNEAKADLKVELGNMDMDVQLFEESFGNKMTPNLILKRFKQARETFMKYVQDIVDQLLRILNEARKLIDLKGANDWINVLLRELQKVIKKAYEKEKDVEDSLLSKLGIKIIKEQKPVETEDIYKF